MSISTLNEDFEREKWAAEVRLREREIAVKEREQDSRNQELQTKLEENKRAKWTNPLVLAVLAASLAAGGNAAVALINGILQRSVEETRATAQNTLEGRKADGQQHIEEAKAEAARILEVIKTNDPDKAAVNLGFLLDTGLITNKERRQSLAAYLAKRKPGQGPTLPAPDSSASTHVSLMYTCRMKDSGDVSVVIEQLTESLKKSGRSGFTVEKDKPNRDDRIWITGAEGGGFAILAEPAVDGAVRVEVYGTAKKTRSDDEIFRDPSAQFRELVPALVRRKLGELVVDPSCVT